VGEKVSKKNTLPKSVEKNERRNDACDVLLRVYMRLLWWASRRMTLRDLSDGFLSRSLVSRGLGFLGGGSLSFKKHFFL
jgi:hypothetical protein